MDIQTKYLGEVSIDESSIIQFHNGIPGFFDEKQFVLLDLPGNPAFHILQSVLDQHIAFILTDPFNFYQSYTFELDDKTIENLSIQSQEEVAVFSIVTLKQPFEQSTINLKAPIIINSKDKYGKQLILHQGDFPSKASLTSENVTKLKGNR